ncbi:ParB/RepB/Spo0J family partition protein [Hoeflea sp.]|uniref:ParB/RepB/Spo0J family partition protein n=1 Tax=Hoeflea sp. TaxID=1940281 RepID=UPI0025B7F340|nr:ParB/RepB/Spo0J family partition protein [Hoeflea sp.]
MSGRSNRLAELAAGALVSRTHELVDPARCRMWIGHNRDYAALSEERCRDLIESLKAQGKQEVPALVRRVRDDPNYDFEVVCGARRHWSVSWLRAHNYPDFRFLIEVRELTDEEAFRLSDLENRAREDISDFERARDYLRALDQYYDGRQNLMADRINVTTSWLSRYLDLARLPAEIMAAFVSMHDLGIRHATQIKPLLKPEERKRRVLSEAGRIAAARAAGEAVPNAPADVIRLLAATADAPKKTGSPRRSGHDLTVVNNVAGKPMVVLERVRRGKLKLTLPLRSGADRAELDAAVATLLDEHWQ